jgi:O-antigen ligase
VVAVIGAAVWPFSLALVFGVVGLVLLARTSPAASFVIAVAAFGWEGTLKVLLTYEGTPTPFESKAVVAAALDVALVAAIAALFVRDRGTVVRQVWATATRFERTVFVLLAAWIAVSVLQIPQSGDISQGLHGFRLSQLYVLAAPAAVVAFWPSRRTHDRVRLLLALVTAIAFYAALRVAVGPSDIERSYALDLPTVAEYGDVFRGVGSFSSAIGLGSFLAPLAAFAAVTALLIPRLRLLAVVTFAAAITGIIGSYGRAPLLAIGVGVGCATLFLLLRGGRSRRAKLMVIGAFVALLAVGSVSIIVASRISPGIELRTRGILHPAGDRSLDLRTGTWDKAIRTIRDHPLGLGLGRVGRATASGERQPVATDNSFLKVFVEQGVAIGVLFMLAVLGLVVALLRRLGRLSPNRSALGLAALAGFVAFVATFAVAEYIEQPGKVLAWSLLGLAIAQAFGSRDDPDEDAALEAAAMITERA